MSSFLAIDGSQFPLYSAFHLFGVVLSTKLLEGGLITSQLQVSHSSTYGLCPDITTTDLPLPAWMSVICLLSFRDFRAFSLFFVRFGFGGLAFWSTPTTSFLRSSVDSWVWHEVSVALTISFTGDFLGAIAKFRSLPLGGLYKSVACFPAVSHIFLCILFHSILQFCQFIDLCLFIWIAGKPPLIQALPSF